MIRDIIEIHEPDIVCMQEVLSNSLNYFMDNLNQYNFSVNSIERNYGEVILSKNELKDIQIVPFQSIFGRELHTATTTLGDKEIRVGTFHLESIFHDGTPKLLQFMHSIKVLDEYYDVFLMGDTNITDADESLFNLLEFAPNWKDVWLELDKPENARYTYDSDENSYAEEPFRNRLDRIYYKSDHFYPIAIKLVGTTANDGVYASDHFGVLSIFDY